MDELKSSKTRILLTGSNGFLGQKCTDLIVQTTPYVLCCTSQSENRNPMQVGYTFEKLDLLDHQALAQLIDHFQPTQIIHTAAMTSVEACEKDPELCQKLNVDTVQCLVNQCQEKQIHLTFLSTDFVFDGKAGPYTECDATLPCNAYGRSKVLAENIILNAPIDAAILRTILVYGIIADKNRSNLVLWAKGKLEAKEPIKVVCDQYRMPTWVDDLAKACILSIEKNAKGIFHISSEELFSIMDAVKLVAQHWSLDQTLISPIHAADIGQADNRPASTGFILDKAKRELGYQPTPFLASLIAIERQINFFNN